MLQRSDSRDLVHNWQKMNMVRLVLETVATEDYPAFCRLPTNTIIRTSPEFLAALPPTIREYFTLQAGMWGQDNVEKEGITDSWGNWYNMFITVTNGVGYPPTNFWLLNWSNGPNGKNEFNRGYGKGDDVAMQPFNITVYPPLPPQDASWHPPLP